MTLSEIRSFLSRSMAFTASGYSTTPPNTARATRMAGDVHTPFQGGPSGRVNCMAESFEDALMEGLRHSGVSVNCALDVLKDGPHL